MRGDVPEQDGEDAAVGSGAGLEIAGAEEGGEGPGPAGAADERACVVHGLILLGWCPADGEGLRVVVRGRREASRGRALEEVVVEVGEDGAGEEGEETGGYVVEHDAGAGGEGFEFADGPGLEDVEEAEEEEG